MAILLIALAVGPAEARGKPPKDQPPQEEVKDEPDRVLRSGKPLTGVISDDGDRDWFSFDISQPSLVTISLKRTDVRTTLDAFFDQYGPDDSEVTSDNGSGIGWDGGWHCTALIRDFPLDRPGRYKVEAGEDWFGQGPYQIRLMLKKR